MFFVCNVFVDDGIQDFQSHFCNSNFCWIIRTHEIKAWNLRKLWSGRAPNSTETQKEFKWLTSDSSRPTPKSELKVTRKWLRTPSLSQILCHFWVTWGDSGVGPFWVTLESLEFFQSLEFFLFCCRVRSTPTSHSEQNFSVATPADPRG